MLVAALVTQAGGALFARQPAAGDEPTRRLPETTIEGGRTVDPPASAPPPAPPALPAPSPFAGTIYDSPFATPPVTGYGALRAIGGTLTDTPLLSIPQGLGVVTEDALRDQQIFSVSEAFRNVSGVTSDHTTGNVAATAAEFGYLSRGFPTTYRRWNGFRSDLIQSSIDTANIERIEFIKGPSSVLYGASDAGGFLNILTKQPLREDFTRATLSSGSWGLARTEIDANRVVNDFTAFRLNVGLQTSDSFRDFVNDDRILIAPVVSVDLTENTRVTFEAEYYSTNTQYDWGILAVNGDLNALPRSRFLMDPADTTYGDYWKAAVRIDHEINEDWSARLGYYWSNAHQFVRTNSPNGAVAGSIYGQTPGLQETKGDLPSLNAYVAGRHETEYATHHLTAGMEYEWIRSNVLTEFFFGDTVFQDAYNPIYTGNVPTFTQPAPVHSNTEIQAQIASLQDRIEFNEYWEVVGGVAYQNFDRKFAGGFATGADNQNGFTPRGSVIFHPTPGVSSVWYSYTESMFVQNPVYPGETGAALPPTEGRQHEIGLRIAPTDDFILSVSAYDLTKTSVPFFTFLPIPPFPTFALPLDARSRGIEVDAYGQLSDRWSVIANYSYIDVRAIDDGALADFGQLPLVPHNTINVWSRYNLVDQALYGRRNAGREVLGVGLGMRWTSEMESLVLPDYFLAGGPVTLPSYVTVDAGLFYTHDRLSASLYLQNLGDVTYYTSGIGAFVNPGNPFNVRASVSYRF